MKASLRTSTYNEETAEEPKAEATTLPTNPPSFIHSWMDTYLCSPRWTPSTVLARYASCSSSSITDESVRLLPACVVWWCGSGRRQYMCVGVSLGTHVSLSTPPRPPSLLSIPLTFNNDAVNAQGRVGAHHPSPAAAVTTSPCQAPHNDVVVWVWCGVKMWSRSQALHSSSRF